MTVAPKYRAWTVVAPGPLARIDENLWHVEDDVPGAPGMRRRMTLVRRGDGKLVFFNAIPVGDDGLAAIRALGEPAYLFIPNALHMLDAAAFTEKLGVRAFGPPQSLDAVRTRLPETAPYDELPADPAHQVLTVDGFKTGEGLLLARTGEKVSAIVADLVMNQRHGTGFFGFMFRMMGFTGDAPRLPKPVLFRVGDDRAKLRAFLEKLALTPGLARVVPSHGELIETDPAGALRGVASMI
jgi:hypothetical protein